MVNGNFLHFYPKMISFKKWFILSFVLLTCLFRVNGQTWDVPADKKTRTSTLLFNAETAKKGETLFQRNCQSCHGEPGKGNYVSLNPSPGDPATDKFQKQTDGALFYKMTTGRSPMPQFKDVLSEEERWQIIAYFRSFNKSYVQPPINGPGKAAEVPKALLTIHYDSIKSVLQVNVTDTLKKPLPHAELNLFVKRYFGNLQIGESETTDESGIARFDFPKDIPGDKTGKLILFVSLSSKEGEMRVSDTLSIGVPTNLPPLTAKRAMWNIGKKAPVWLIVSYLSVVITIWAFLFYIVYLLVKIRNANKESQKQYHEK